MATIKTTRVRQEWVDQLLRKHGTVAEVAEAMNIDRSTAYRWLSGKSEASPRFIANALITFPITFDEAFVVVEEEAERRKARIYHRATGRAA